MKGIWAVRLTFFCLGAGKCLLGSDEGMGGVKVMALVGSLTIVPPIIGSLDAIIKEGFAGNCRIPDSNMWRVMMMASFRWHWWPWHRYSLCGAKRQGRLDGQENIPAWQNPDQPPYVLELVEAAENDIRILAQEWHKRDRVLKQRMEAAQVFKEQSKQKVDQALKDLEAKNRHYEEVHGTSPPAGTDARLFWYWSLLTFLFVFEFPINAIVFRLFGEAEVFTYVATAAIAIALLACAHQLGVFLREGKWDKTKIGITVALVVAPILVIGAVAWLRQLYLSQAAEEVRGAWSQGMLFAFATFNFIIFIVAMVASYLVHDPLLFAVYKARKQLANAQKMFTKCEVEYEKAKTDREKTKAVYRTRAHQIKDTAQVLMHAYRTENLRHRTDREQYESQGSYQPKSFNRENQPKITIPPELEADEQLRGETQ